MTARDTIPCDPPDETPPSGILSHERSGEQNADSETIGDFTVTLVDRQDDDADEQWIVYVTADGFAEEITAFVDHHSRRLCIDGDDPEANRAVEKWVKGRTEVRGVLP
jgi:hypothetical protein